LPPSVVSYSECDLLFGSVWLLQASTCLTRLFFPTLLGWVFVLNRAPWSRPSPPASRPLLPSVAILVYLRPALRKGWVRRHGDFPQKHKSSRVGSGKTHPSPSREAELGAGVAYQIDKNSYPCRQYAPCM